MESLAGSWKGTKSLWMRPTDPTHVCDATLEIEGETVRYTWSFQGEPQSGVLTRDGAEALWSDTFHQGTVVRCRALPSFGAPALSVGFSYPAPTGPDWGWRITLTRRPDDTLILQMWNVLPWGEEARAVQIEAKRA